MLFDDGEWYVFLGEKACVLLTVAGSFLKLVESLVCTCFFFAASTKTTNTTAIAANTAPTTPANATYIAQ